MNVIIENKKINNFLSNTQIGQGFKDFLIPYHNHQNLQKSKNYYINIDFNELSRYLFIDTLDHRYIRSGFINEFVINVFVIQEENGLRDVSCWFE